MSALQPTPQPRLAAFGSSRIGTESEVYQDVLSLSEKIARSGWHGMTGGHQGMMAAFSEGMHAGGGHIQGITLERFPTPPNNTFSKEIRARNFFERMGTMIEQADAWLVLPGGLGTLSELAMTWDLIAIRVLEPRPLLLYGAMWQPIISILSEQLVLSTDKAFDSIRICESHQDVLDALQSYK
ncbi:LOG family protein [Mariprofundus ferrooxydans]|nr:LOG family protein [Mariprofundus ferrooxydans]